MSDVVLKAEGLTKIFKNRMAVDHVSFELKRGTVTGLLGPNGAGKSTTIKMLMNLLRPSEGRGWILGQALEDLPPELWNRVGYLVEDQKFYGWMTVSEMIRLTERFYSGWDRAYEAELVKRLEPPLDQKINTLSKGTRGKLALLSAMAFHPELLVLDDPVSGLDPVVRHDFLEQIIELLQREGRTVLFSSHILDEVERIADRILIIKEGRILADDQLDHMKETMKRVVLSFDAAPPAVDASQAVRVVTHDREVHVTLRDLTPEALESFKQYQPVSVTVQDLDLSQIFVELVKGRESSGRSGEAAGGGQ